MTKPSVFLKVLIGIIIGLLLNACALGGQLRARQLLSKCTYKIVAVDVGYAGFSSRFRVEGKEFDSKTLSYSSLKSIGKGIESLLKGQFAPDFSKLELNLKLEVNNPNNQYVQIDSLLGKASFIEGYTMDFKHDKRLRIEESSIDTIQLEVDVPLQKKALKLLDTKTIGLDGTLFFQVEVLPDQFYQLPLEIDEEVPFPKAQIEAAIEKQKEKLIAGFKKLIPSTEGLMQKLKGLF